MTAEKPFRDTFRKTSGKNIGETRETAVNAGIPSVRTRPAKTKTAETRPASADASGSGSVPDSGFVHTHGTDRPVRFPWYRLILLAFAVLAAVTGMLTALNRAGLPALHQPRPLVAAHGALMVFGFMGTAIGMERGVAYRSGGRRNPRWGFLAPLFGALGVLSIFVLTFTYPLPQRWQAIPGILWTISMAFLAAVYAGIWMWQNSLTLIVQILGALTGCVSLVLWSAGWSATVLAPSWMVFLVLTIVGERLELSRVSFRSSPVEGVIMAASVVSVAGGFLIPWFRETGYVVLGCAFLVLLVTMLASDIARRTFRLGGFTGFMGCAMLVAYFWGILGSSLWVILPHTYSNMHSAWSGFSLVCFDLGFVMSMVIAHAFLIVPAILRRPARWTRAMWVPLALLTAGVATGFAGALTGQLMVGKVSSAIEILALASLVLTVAGTYIVQNVRRTQRKQTPGDVSRNHPQG